MKCQVTSDTTRKVMISREVKVASYKEICGGEKIRVHLGYNNDPKIMTVKDNKLLQIPSHREEQGAFSVISQESIHVHVAYILFTLWFVGIPQYKGCCSKRVDQM